MPHPAPDIERAAPTLGRAGLEQDARPPDASNSLLPTGPLSPASGPPDARPRRPQVGPKPHGCVGEGSVRLLVVPDDPRLGAEWCTYRQLAERRGQSAGSMQQLMRRYPIEPVGYLAGRGQQAVFDVEGLSRAGIWPSRAFDHESECWLADYARERSLPPEHVESRIRARLAIRLGVSSVDADELERAGLGRRVGRRWVINRAAVDELFADTYDPESEATAHELLQELGGYPTVAQLTGALRRAGVEGRRVHQTGKRVTVFDRAAARAAVSGRFRRDAIVRSQTANPTECLRRKVGPFLLGAPTTSVAVRWADADWLLGSQGAARSAYAAREPDGPPTEGAPIAWLEGHLSESGDLEGLLLLSAIINRRFSPNAEEGRTEAVLRLFEKREDSLS